LTRATQSSVARVQHVGAAIGLGQRDLVRGAHGADDDDAQMLGPLAGDLTHTTGGGMEQNRLTGLHGKGGLEKIARGQALQKRRRRDLVGDVGRQFHRRPSWDVCGFGIGAAHRAIGDAVADL